MEREVRVRGGRILRMGPIGCWVGSVLALAVLAAAPDPLAAQRGRGPVQEGNRLYEEGRFEEAHQKYLEALLEDPESPLIRFNDGAALYQGEDFQRAMERFQQALESEDTGLQSSAWYNLGNALYRQQQLPESLEAYKRALLADPSDTDSKHNLERVLEQLQQQEEQEQQQGEDQNQEGQEQQQGQPEPQDQDQEPQAEPQEQQPSPQEQEPQEGEGQPQPQPGEMTPEEAQRLLEALQEDPGEVNRRQAPVTGRRPRKIW